LIRRDFQGTRQPPFVDIYRADLRSDSLEAAFDGVDVLVHLAARVVGNPQAHMADTVVGTERLLEAMANTATRRLILTSSLTVYNWADAPGELTEDSPLESDLYSRDAYAIAKVWQERVTRRISEQHHWDLTVLRPGYIWGRTHEYPAGLGQEAGGWHLVFGPATRLPLTYVENCADCVSAVVEKHPVSSETFNVVDGHDISSWQYAGEYLRRTGSTGRRIPIPYHLPLAAARLAGWMNQQWWHGDARLPGLLVPRRFQSRFARSRVSTRKLREGLGWHPPFDFEQCLLRTYQTREPNTEPNGDIELRNV
jgi:nucleoside-diphosphate-sugar epimerase